MKAILSFLVRAFVYTFSLLGDLLYSLIDDLEKQKGFNAKFGKESDISSRFNHGFLISTHRRLTLKQSFENVLLAGPPGCGKTSHILIPTLMELKNCSVIQSDPAGEIAMVTSGYLSRYFPNIQVINFSDSSMSAGFNPLSRIKKPNDINKVAYLLTTNLDNGSNTDPFWRIQSTFVTEIFIRLVLHQPVKYRNIANILFAIKTFAANPKKVDVWISKTKDAPLILDYKSLISMPDRTLNNVIATVQSALKIFSDPELAKITAHDSFSFETIRKIPTIIFLQNSIKDQEYTRPITSLFFEQLYGHILERLPRKDELNLFIILEECSSMMIPLLNLALANCRKHRCATLCSVQSPSQLKALYKDEAESILSSCRTQIYMPGQTSIETLQKIETLSGKCIYTDDKGIERVKPLITVDEARLLPKNRTMIFSGNHPVVKGRTSPYYKSYKYKAFSQIPPLPLKGDIPDGPIPLMQ